jgi:hypothetical protein
LVRLGWASIATLVFLTGCPSPHIEDSDAAADASVVPDAGATDAGSADSGVVADAGTPDAGFIADGGFKISNLSLTPASGEGESHSHRVRGGLRASAGGQAQSHLHRLRGSLVPIAP